MIENVEQSKQEEIQQINKLNKGQQEDKLRNSKYSARHGINTHGC